MRQFYGNVSGESIFLAFVLFSWLSRLRFVSRAWELVVVWLGFRPHSRRKTTARISTQTLLRSF